MVEKVVKLDGKSAANMDGAKGDRIGEDIRRLRKARKMTLNELSDKAGISVGYLSQIERNISSPTVKAMFDISHALGVNVGWFFHSNEDQQQEESRYIVRSDKRLKLRFESGITDYLLNTKAVGDLEVLLSTFAPGSSSGEEAYQHEGEECGIILAGKFELWIEEKSYLLNEGDSFSFPSTLKHSYRNPGDTETKVMWCITPPTY